jgi:hypothetical protein
MAEVKRLYSSALTGYSLEIQKADLGIEKGTYYRVRAPANSVEAAANLCSDVKRLGGDCFVRTN